MKTTKKELKLYIKYQLSMAEDQIHRLQRRVNERDLTIQYLSERLELMENQREFYKGIVMAHALPCDGADQLLDENDLTPDDVYTRVR